MFRFAVVLTLLALANALPRVPMVDPRIDVNGDWRVVGGSNAPPGEYPFIVSLRSAANSLFCGGSILNSQWVLTAAHCIVGRTVANTIVVAGTNTLNSGGVSVNSVRLISHANYNSQSITNDIGVVQLANSLAFTNLITATTLNTGNTGAVAAILIGWGRTSTGGSIPNNLQHLNTNTLTHAQCQNAWGSRILESQICAFTQSGQGACNGDSGGPLIQQSNRAQLGIVSFGVACAQGVPDVYSRVSSFITWINSALAS